jgi:hypothetical protein
MVTKTVFLFGTTKISDGDLRELWARAGREYRSRADIGRFEAVEVTSSDAAQALLLDTPSAYKVEIFRGYSGAA